MEHRGANRTGQRQSAHNPEIVASDHSLIAMFNQIRDELTSTLAYILGNREDAMDAVQDCFLKCWRSRQSAAEVDNLRAWIFRVGLNTAKDMQRSAWNRRVKPMVAEEAMLATHDHPATTVLENRESLQKLRDAIQTLRQDEKEVFLLRQNGELTYEQIAEIRKTPVGTVKTQMRAAITKLKRVLNPDPVESP